MPVATLIPCTHHTHCHPQPSHSLQKEMPRPDIPGTWRLGGHTVAQGRGQGGQWGRGGCLQGHSSFFSSRSGGKNQSRHSAMHEELVTKVMIGG